MKVVKGNIWNYWEKGHWIVIPTNGMINSKGENVMGKGLAKQASDRFPGLAKSVGKDIIHYKRNTVGMYRSLHLFVFPVKRKWWKSAILDLIEESTEDLVKYVDNYKDLFNKQVILPKVGCGAGKLSWEKQVKPMLDRYLDDRFLIVDFK